MAHIVLNSVNIDFPIYNAKARSFRGHFIRTVGGKINSTNDITVIRALSNINLELREGDRVGVIGNNGAGKTTLLRVLSGVYEPTAGSIEIEGKISSLTDIQMGMDPEATGEENIILRGIFMGMKINEIKSKMQEIIEFSQLDDYISMPMRTYSSGMYLRLAFAVSTCIQPEILILDEMIGVGDMDFVQKAKERTLQLIDTSKIMVMSSHDLAILRKFTEEALKILINISETKIYFTASQLNFTDCKEYLRENLPQFEANFILSINDTLTNRLVINLKKLIDYLARKSVLKRIKIFKKIAYQFGFIIDFFNIKFSFVPKQYKDYFDVYFSPQHPIPKQVLKISAIKKVIFLHDLIPLLFPEYVSFVGKIFYQVLIKHFNNQMTILCCSNTSKNDFLKFRSDIDEKRVKVVYLSVAELFKPITDQVTIGKVLNKYNIPQNGKYFLTLSSLNPRKNFTHVITAFVEFIKTYNLSDLYLGIVGAKGWGFDDIFAAIDAAEQYKDKIIMTGFIDDEALPAIYSAALSFVFMSLYEGFGLPVLEAMKCGIPIIGSNISSVPEVMGNTGIKISPIDKGLLIDAMHRIYFDEKARNQLKAEAIKQADQFNYAKFSTELAKAIIQ
ncbi:glycosyl transferase group 1 [Reticulomyxa filosa]|uniref:Glycosyl transferase group 1 n=1 Tax=Reticulomyxa filosa TaxID=46433 RepID=X6N100_RETFI|nr:glycosyl transferase group 1 [Reticulomyxa filosa]|eukprot:ETO19593.1 glycosyl transferase group 1 [Reticulomyxa filosa]